MRIFGKPNGEKIFARLSKKYGEEKVVNAGINAALDNVRNDLNSGDWKKAIWRLRTMADSIEEVVGLPPDTEVSGIQPDHKESRCPCAEAQTPREDVGKARE